MMKMVVNDGVFTFIEIFSASGIDTGTAVLVLTLLINIVFGINGIDRTGTDAFDPTDKGKCIKIEKLAM